MFRLFDFNCSECNHSFEEMIPDDSKTLLCPLCKGNSDRLIATPHIDWRRMGIDPGFPSAYEKWGKAKTQHHKTDLGSMHGGRAPNLLMY